MTQAALDAVERGEVSIDWNEAHAALPDGWRVARVGEILDGEQAGWWTAEICYGRYYNKTLRTGPAALMWCAVKAGMGA